jgi:outer membrane protein assembly factor BamA
VNGQSIINATAVHRLVVHPVSDFPPLLELLDRIGSKPLKTAGWGSNRDIDILFRQQLDSAGYGFARIISRSTDTIRFDPGALGGIAIRGNHATTSSFIRSFIPLQPGTVLTASRLQKIQAALYSTGLFTTVNLDVIESDSLIVTVVEKQYYRIRTGFRYDDFFLGEGYIEPAYENLLGRGICLSSRLQYGLRREKYSLELSSNQMMSSWWANALRLQSYICTERIVKRESDPIDTIVRLEERTLHKAGMSVFAGFELKQFALLLVGIRSEQYGIKSSERSIFNDPFSSLGLKNSTGLLRFSLDNLDKYPFPLSGQKHSINLTGTHKSLGGTSSFIKIDASLGAYTTLREKHTFLARTSTGWTWSSDSLPPVEFSYLGGLLSDERNRDISVSSYIPFIGLDPRTLPGERFFTVHGEYRYTPMHNLYLYVLADWGLAWNRGSVRTFNTFTELAPLGFGAAVAYQSIAGPLRCAWGRILKNSSENLLETQNLLYISMGYDF